MNTLNTDDCQPAYISKAKNNCSDEHFQQPMMQMFVNSIHHITSKCNISYTLLIIVCITAILALYNEYASFSQRFVKLSHLVHSEFIQDSIQTSLTTSAQNAGSVQIHPQTLKSEHACQLLNEYIRNFVDSQFFTFPIIGIKISTADVTTFLSLAILVITLWCYVCIRSENFATGKVLNMTQEYPLIFRKYIFYNICFHNIFFPTTFRNKPYDRLSDKKLGMGLSKTLSNNKNKNDKYNTLFNRTTRRGNIAVVLFLLPILIASANSIVMLHESFDITKHIHILDTDRCIELENTDIVLIYSDTPEKYADEYTDKQKIFLQLSKPYRMDANGDIYNKIERLIKYTAAIRWVTILSVVLGLLIFYFCWHCIKYLKRTNDIMFCYKSAIKCEEEFNTLYQQLEKEQINITSASIVRLSQQLDEVYDNKIFGFTVFTPNNIEELKKNINNLGFDKDTDKGKIQKHILELIKHESIRARVENMHNEWYCIIFETQKKSKDSSNYKYSQS